MYGGFLLAGILGVIASPAGFYAVVGFFVLLKLGSALVAAWLAREPESTVKIPSTRTHVLYIATLALITFTVMYPLRPALLGYKLYHIPSSPMAPTLSPGDYIIADTRYGTPEVGDIVVYRVHGIEAAKRIAAVGGDTLAIVDGEVIVNGRNLGLFHAPANQVTLARSHELAPQYIEPGYVYLLGDNRDYSNDSRFIGPVAVENVTGKVTGILFSREQARIGTSFK
jgi:signal peptidase I